MDARMMALLCIMIYGCVQADDQIVRYKAALNKKMLSSYQLSFTVTYPVCKPSPVYEKITKAYRINENNGNRLSIVTKTIGGKTMVSRKLVTPTSVTVYDDESPYVDKYNAREGAGKYKEHNINYIKLGKYPQTIGTMANGTDDDYVTRFMTNEYKGRSVDEKGVVTHIYKGKISVFTLKFANSSATVPIHTSITAQWDKEGKSQMIDAINCEYSEGSQMPSRVEYTRTIDNVLQERQVISDIKLETVDAKLAFADSDLGIKVNTDAIVDNTYSKFWDGNTFSDKPVTQSSVVLRINYFYLINGAVLILLGILVMYMKNFRDRTHLGAR